MTSEAQPRADARRNIERILDAAETLLGRDPSASMGDIAAEAGLGRVTVYGHFGSRQALVEAVVRRALLEVDAALQDVDLSGDAGAALERLIQATWQLTVRSGRLLIAAEEALPASTIREMHQGGLEDRVRDFIASAQRRGEFRSDLPTDWFQAIFHAVVHAASTEIHAGRLEPTDATRVITATLLGALTSLQGAS
ncbi:TetR/AcrR family transcriptional regulator [Lysobacter korlensis]|uniref:TetR/AcrR family transcriptional regulator n=1 Tax=Lysobacter korlensis TaxID=553636 RepID=A0ABV6RWA6_9GAMM